MKGFKLFFLTLIAFMFIGCQDDTHKEGMHKVHWDRDMCERCKMVVSERKFAVQVIDKHDKAHMYDDIGCALIWFKEEKQDWLGEAKIWINDAISGEWIDAKKADYAVGNLTPMGYGVSAYSKKTFPEGMTKLNFKEASKVIYDIDEEQQRRRAQIRAQRAENEK